MTTNNDIMFRLHNVTRELTLKIEIADRFYVVVNSHSYQIRSKVLSFCGHKIFYLFHAYFMIISTEGATYFMTSAQR